MDDFGPRSGRGRERILTVAHENGNREARLDSLGGGEVADGVMVERAHARKGNGAFRKQRQGWPGGCALLHLHIEPAVCLDREIDDVLKQRHIAAALQWHTRDVCGIMFSEHNTASIRAHHRLVMRHDDDAVAREPGVELPHIGAEARGDAESRDGVLMCVGAGTAMADRERPLRGARRPTVAPDESLDRSLHSHTPFRSNTRSFVGSMPHSTGSP